MCVKTMLIALVTICLALQMTADILNGAVQLKLKGQVRSVQLCSQSQMKTFRVVLSQACSSHGK